MAYIIETKYVGPTDHRGSRVRARAFDFNGKLKTVWAHWDDALDIGPNHAASAEKLVAVIRKDVAKPGDTAVTSRVHDHPTDRACCIVEVEVKNL